jgi:hypothetical protein
LIEDNSTVVTAGQTQRTSIDGAGSAASFAVTCPSPVMIDKKKLFQLSLKWLGSEEAVVIPFNGAANNDIITFDMTWSALRTVSNTHVIVDVDGLDVDVKHTCKFTQPDNDEITKTTDAKFLDDKGRKLDCGVQPTGFAIEDTSAAVEFEIYVKGTKIKASYAGPTGEGPVVQLNTCLNGETDGDETDEDCGGLCSGCGVQQACKVDADCADGIPCTDKKCGQMGKTAALAVESCKALLSEGGGTTSGLFWIDPDGKGDPFEVYCDQKNSGGGWIVLQHLKRSAGNHPCGLPAYTQGWNQWDADGIGTVQSYADMLPGQVIQSDKCYWLAFKNWGRIIGFSDAAGVISQMQMVSDSGFGDAVTMNNFYVDGADNKKYGLRMSNYAAIRQMMCGNSDNCFAAPDVGFSTGGLDRDSYSGHCSGQHYGSAGWWYAHCHHHVATQSSVDQQTFAGCQGTRNVNCNTQTWTYYVK